MNNDNLLSLLNKAAWIYENGNPQEDEYTSYFASFESKGEELTLVITGDSDLAFYLNGELAYFGISPAYPSHPIADAIKIKSKAGHNDIKIDLYYFGATSFSSYCKGSAGLKFALVNENGETVLLSSKEVLSCPNPNYLSHQKKKITSQMGYSYCYDANGIAGELHPSLEVNRPGETEMRINKRCELGGRAGYEITHLGKGHYLLDFKKETIGYLDLDFISSKKQKIKFTYAEHKEGESLAYLLGDRDFSLDFVAKPGSNLFLGTFRRLGLRYLEVFAEEDLDIHYIGIQKVVYPFTKIPHKLDNPLLQTIYDTCVYTLECCYHEHYEDCPWREQCLYAMDSFNQALAGFVCFENTEQIKSSLQLIAYDDRADGLLSICSPSSSSLTIPSFSLFFVRAVDLYLSKTGDIDFVKKIYPKVKSIMDVFFSQEENGLLYTFVQDGTWNFYEWADTLDGGLGQKQDKVADLILNGLFALVLPCFENIQDKLGIEHDYSSFKERNKEAARRAFLKGDFFRMSEACDVCSQYGNALAILCGYASKEEGEVITEELMNPCSEFVKSTLASRPFVYDALLRVEKGNASYVLEDIKRTYGRMLADGATTFYETELGWKDFDNAGSLCHGWSACPIYYFEKMELYK